MSPLQTCFQVSISKTFHRKVVILSTEDLTKPDQEFASQVDPDIPESDIRAERDEQNIRSTLVKRMTVKNTEEKTFRVKVDLEENEQKQFHVNNQIYSGFTRHKLLEFKELPNVIICYNWGLHLST